MDEASVKVEGEPHGSIGQGFMVLFGSCESDTVEIADKMLKKLAGLRIFPDSEGKTNLSIQDVGGSILLVSQFTLYADCRKGYRPSFFKAGDPCHAEKMYDHAVKVLRETYGFTVETGSFGAHMEVSLVNNGPFTIMLDSDEIC